MNEFAQEVWEITYKYKDEKNLSDTFKRVAKAIASVENEKERKKWEKEFYQIMQEDYFCPGGRILANAGTDFQTTLFNCYTAPKIKYDPDSIEGILESLLIQTLTLKSEGGWGENFSYIRPRTAFIKGVGIESPGSTKYMEIFNKSSEIITSGSGHEDKERNKDKTKKERIRKGAQMGLLFNVHPDVEEFVGAKRVPNKLDKFNVSVAAYNSFMDLVNEVEKTGIDQNIDLYFPDTTCEKYKTEWDGHLEGWKKKGYPIKIYKTISVKYLWELIMKSTYDFNDPGIVFMDRANETYFANYMDYITKTNPCAEQPMPAGSVCDLGSLVLPSFYINGKFNYDRLGKVTKVAVRFLDNVNNCSKTPHEDYTNSARKMRRIGLGIMGWGSLLYLMKIRFASKEAEELKDKIMAGIVYNSIETSAELAEERGWFEGCDPVRILENEFFKRINLPDTVYQKVLANGLRNSSLFSIQPNGNTSVLKEVMSGGCEPVPFHEFIRTIIVQSPPENIKEICPKYWQGEFHETDLFKFSKEGEETILKGTDSNGITYKIDKNRGLTKEVLCEDYAVRLLKENGEWNPKADYAVDITNLSVEEHITDLKGFAKWIDASISKTVNLPKDYPYESFKKLYLDAYNSGVIKGITTYREGTMTNVLAPIKKDNKRPKKLPCHIHHITVKGEKYYVATGLKEDGSLYEIFVGQNGIDHSITEGFIQRIKAGKYSLISNNEIVVDDMCQFCSNEEESVARLASVALRNNVDIKIIVEQLEKTKGLLVGFTKAMVKVLRRYIPTGTQSEELCPDCKTKLIFSEGCKKCQNCPWSKC